MKNVAYVKVKLFNQSIPPAYLQDRFSDSQIEPADKDYIQRLYYLTSHLNTIPQHLMERPPSKTGSF
ncbi:MAG: hypothetical protein ACN4GM_00750 [Gammaproteobacteria bacterium]